jgi:dolichol-phosphate mannosyltransferase
MKQVTVVIPVYNEAESIEEHLRTIMAHASKAVEAEIRCLVVDDGSTDQTAQILAGLSQTMPGLHFFSLTRNFGKEAAILAGLEHAEGDAVVVMDSDLQHPPELLQTMIALWLEGVQVVEACKSSRGGEGLDRRLLARSFYSLFGLMTTMDLKGLSDYKLMDASVVRQYCAMPERKRFFRGLIHWMGCSSARVYFEVPRRTQGRTGWTTMKLLRLSVDALTSFSSAPLYLVNVLALISLVLGVVIGGLALYDKLTGQAVSGFTTVILLILLIGGFTMFGLGLIGIYVAQIFDEVKRRPHYVLKRTSGPSGGGE